MVLELHEKLDCFQDYPYEVRRVDNRQLVVTNSQPTHESVYCPTDIYIDPVEAGLIQSDQDLTAQLPLPIHHPFSIWAAQPNELILFRSAEQVGDLKAEKEKLETRLAQINIELARLTSGAEVYAQRVKAIQRKEKLLTGLNTTLSSALAALELGSDADKVAYLLGETYLGLGGRYGEVSYWNNNDPEQMGGDRDQIKQIPSKRYSKLNRLEAAVEEKYQRYKRIYEPILRDVVADLNALVSIPVLFQRREFTSYGGPGGAGGGTYSKFVMVGQLPELTSAIRTQGLKVSTSGDFSSELADWQFNSFTEEYAEYDHAAERGRLQKLSFRMRTFKEKYPKLVKEWRENGDKNNLWNQLVDFLDKPYWYANITLTCNTDGWDDCPWSNDSVTIPALFRKEEVADLLL